MSSATASPPPSPLAIGSVVAKRYEVRRELGRGGMGVVYLCEDRVSFDRVALKCVFVDRAQDVKSKDAVWFRQEARALAVLDHPAVVHARDFGTLPDGSPYLVMDALQGRSVHVWKYLTRIPWPVIWTVMDQVLGGLAHAHARGIIHGDLKPSNIMIDPRGGTDEPRAYVLDLGLAWLLSDHIDPRLARVSPDAPTMPFGLGTPGWMAPEQIRHQLAHIGPPTDLYALGSILYELLARKEIFEGTPTEILRKHRDEPVTEVALPDDAPPGVATFVKRLLEKSPWKRFRFAADARKVWETFKPLSPVRWAAPKVRFRDEQPESMRGVPTPPPSGDTEGLKLAPGILAFRPSPLVGRTDEIGTILQHVQDVADGKGPEFSVILLRGEAGVGKSKIAEWLCETVHERGLAVPLRARYRRTPGALDGMRGAVMGHYNLPGLNRDAIEQALLNEWEVTPDDDQGRTRVAAAATWLKPPTPDETAQVGPSGKRFFLDKPELRWMVIRQVVEQISKAEGQGDGGSKRPLLLWLDDFHLAPPNSIAGLHQLRHEGAHLPVIALITAREEMMIARPELLQRLEALTADVPSQTLQIEPLGADATQALLRASLRLTPEAEEAVISRSRGNPLFALQLVHAWASGGFLSLTPGGYAVDPAALHGRATTTAELWDERLAVLPDAFRPAAFGAAALGEVLHRDVVNALLTTLGYDAQGCLDALMQAQILLPQGHGELRWPHALLQEHLFARLAESADARRVFKTAASALEKHPEANSRRIVRQRVSNLLYAGERPAASGLMLGYVARAWTFLRDVSATRSDLALLEGYVEGGDRAHHKRWRAEAERHAGNLGDARKLAEEARRLFAEQEDRENEAQCLRLLAHIASDQGAPALGRIEAVLARSMFDTLGNAVGKAQCELVLGEIDYLLGDHASARTELTNAAGEFRQTGDRLGLAQCLIIQSLAAQAGGHIDTAINLLLQARTAFDEIGYQLGLAQVDVALAHGMHRAGELEPAYEGAVATLEVMHDLDNPRGEAACERLAAMAALDLGNLSAARVHARLAYTIFDTRLADTWGRVEGLLLLAQVSLADKDVLDAQVHLGSAQALAIEESEPVQHRHLTTAWLALLHDHHDEAAMAIENARDAFPDRRRTGDHTTQLIVRLLDLSSGTPVEALLLAWKASLEESSAISTPLPVP